MYCCQAGQGKLCGQARMEGRQCCRMPQPWLLCLHISYSRHRSCRPLAVQVLLASLAFPTPSFSLFHQTSLVFPSKGRGLASAPCLWRHLLANLQVPAVTPTDKLQSTLRDDLVTKAGLSCLLGQDSSKAPGTFLTASCSRQNRLQGEGKSSMLLSSRETNVKVQEHPALMCSPHTWVVPAHAAGKADWLQHRQEGARYPKTAVLSVGHLSFCKAMPI